METCKSLILSLIAALCLSPCGMAHAKQVLTSSKSPDQVLTAAQKKAMNLLLADARDKDSYLRSNAIEALEKFPQRVLPLAELGLHDPKPVVRFTALVTLGKLKATTHVKAVQKLLNDPDPSVRAAAYFASQQCGASIDISPLARLLMSDRPDVRSNTAMLLGMMGDPSADGLLETAARAPLTHATPVREALTRLQIAEARARLGNRQVLDAVRAAIYATTPELRLVSVGMIGELNDVAQMEDALLAIYNDHNEVLEMRLEAGAVLAEHGRPVVVKSVLDGIETVLDAAAIAESALRAQAAVTLGAIEQAKARIRPQLLSTDPPAVREQFQDTWPTGKLVELLDDADPRVRLSAAAGVVSAANASP